MKVCCLDNTPLSKLTGVGLKQAEKLRKIGLETIQDLLLHLPIRYEDRSNMYHINDLVPGLIVTVAGRILSSKISEGKRAILTSRLDDGSGVITLRFFNFNTKMKHSLSAGKHIVAYGEVKRGRNGLEIIHPEYHFYDKVKGISLQYSLTPIYASTEGLHQGTLRNLINQALTLLKNSTIAELLPIEVYHSFISFPTAIHILHRPSSDSSLIDLEKGRHPAQRRLILEELLAHNLSMLAIREEVKKYQAQPLIPSILSHYTLKTRFLSALPFHLTYAQIRVVNEIEKDLLRTCPMMRLIQGDVGSGKTLVAALSALLAIAHGKQVAFMVPTELLAEQHLETFRKWFEPLNISVGWLFGKQKGKIRLIQQEAIAKGTVSIVIGTHAIFQEKIQFSKLALVIVDEQHRFGVHQRLLLLEKGKHKGLHPHKLIMTATPIPRTLAMTAYADLDISIIDILPPGRIPISTIAIPDTRRDDVIQRIKYACLEEGRQVYWVCTLIEESKLLAAKAVEVTYTELKASLVDIKLGLMHGRMQYKEKQAIMNAFKNGELQLLIATTVIEVGIDVPNASLMIIDNPERLGLAQLHQLRGRVGRGGQVSHCVLLYKTPLTKTVETRLQVLRESNDGFFIAQRDLEIRGPGELLGTRQTGITEFKVADLIRDQNILLQVKNIACHLHHKYPKQASALIERWLPEKKRYTNV